MTFTIFKIVTMKLTRTDPLSLIPETTLDYAFTVLLTQGLIYS